MPKRTKPPAEAGGPREQMRDRRPSSRAEDSTLDLASIRQVQRLGDLLVDEETGEILEWPADAGADRLEYLGRQRAEARRQESAWRQLGGFHGRLLLALLEAEQLDAYNGASVRILRQPGRDNRYGDPAKIPQAWRRFELTPVQLDAIWRCATRLDRQALLEQETAGELPAGLTEFLTAGQIGAPYVRVDTARRSAPRIETELRDDG